MPTMKTKKKKVKAWAVYHTTLKDLGDRVFISRKIAKEFLREYTYHSNPLITKEVLTKYKIIPCTIIYEL